jgi:ribonuclease BN (tRNA processing enzyme)
MFRLLFLGSGSAFTVGTDNYQSNMLLIADNGENLLIDCGSDIRLSLYREGLSYRDITNIYLSHLHSDHVGGLEYMGFSQRFDPHCAKTTLYLSQDLATDLWTRTLSGGMRSIQGGISEINDYFTLKTIPAKGGFVWEGVQFQLVPVLHVDNSFGWMPTYGLWFSLERVQVFLTTDTQFSPDRCREFYERADIIFHDCETAHVPTPVHAHYEELLTLPPAIRRKMWLYGYHPGELPDAIADGFLGFVRRGQIFEFGNGKSQKAREMI